MNHGQKLSAINHLVDISELTSPKKLWNYLTQAIDNALSQRADVITFPEFIWAGIAYAFQDEYDYFRKTSAHIWQSVIPELVARYQHSQALIQLGTAPYLAPSQQLLNRAVTITPKGLLTQDKLFLTPWEQYQGFNASDTIIIGDFQGYRFCVLICFDSEVAQLSAFLRPYHLDLVIVPAATETIYGCHRVHRGGSARAMELGSALLVSQLTGTLQNLDLVNDNCGRSGLYLPAQPPLTLKEISQYSPIIYQGLLVAQYTLPLAQIRSLRHISDETNPALTSSKPNISVIELS